MKKFTTLGGTLFLIWLLFSPIIALGFFSHYYDSLLGHGINLLSLLERKSLNWKTPCQVFGACCSSG